MKIMQYVQSRDAKMSKYILGMDVGGTNVRLGLVDEEYCLHDFQIVSSGSLQNNELSTVENLILTIQSYLEKFGQGKEIAAVSAGFPATLDRERKKILSTPNIRGFNNVEIVDLIEKATGIKTYIETDVDMLLLHDVYKNHLSHKGIVCGFYFGTGFGNAIMIDGKLLAGKNGAAAELGHIPMRGVYGNCGCGNHSCVEMIASGYHLAEIRKKDFPETEIGEMFTKHSDASQIKQMIDDLALATACEINILDPDETIFGGGLVNMKDFPKKMFESALKKYARKPYPAENLICTYAEQSQENGVIGAGLLGFQKLNEKGNM